MTIVGAVCLAALLLPAVVPLAEAAPVGMVGNGNGPPQQWAYGAQTWRNVTENSSNYQYSGRAYFGWEVILTATNTSTSTTQLEADRTIGISYFASYCAPNCAQPRVTGNVSIQAWQHQVEFANLTSNATVDENGSASPALGLMNGSDTLTAGLHESYQIVRAGVVTRGGDLNVAREATAQITFSPALGLVPWNAAANLSWNATSSFTAGGQRQDSYNYTQTTGGQTTGGAGQSNATVQRSGVESVRGKDVGNVTLRNGMDSTGIVLVTHGPFDLDDGLFVASHDANLFGGATQNWTVRAVGPSLASMSRLDFQIDRLHHIGRLLASEATFSTSDQSVGTSGGPTAAGSVSNVTPNSTLQAQPELVTDAQAASNCLTGGCPGASPTSPAASGGMGVLLLALVAAVVVAAAVLVLARPKRRQPSPAPGVGPSRPSPEGQAGRAGPEP
jgi:hypothetical protein